jgi:uncharacterized membrane protein YdfJ with MMPL/SSD domain
MTERLARAAAAHPWLTIGAWLAAIVVSFVLVATVLGGGLTTDAIVTNNPESMKAERLMEQSLPPTQGETTELVVIRNEDLTAEDPAFRAELERLAGELENTGAAALVVSPYEGDGLISEDGHAVLVPIQLRPDEEETVDDLVAVVEAANGQNGFAVNVTGNHTIDRDFNEVSQSDLEKGELRFGLPAAMVILLLVFGAVVAATLPLILAIVSIIVALGLTALVGSQWELSIFVVNMLTGMGLALGIDYALFVVSRFREERARGRSKEDAIAATGATASRAVLFSGTAFVLAMVGLLLVQNTIMRSLATGAILVGVVSVVAALTLLPAVLSLLGDRINRLRIPYIGREIESSAASESRFWSAIVRRVMRRPALYFAVAAGLLLAAASPVIGMNIGAAGVSTLPDSLVSKQGVLALEKSFPTAGSDPARIVIQGDPGDGIARLEDELAGDSTFGRPTIEEGAGITVVSVPVSADALSDRAVDAVEKLRSDYVPTAFAGTDARVYVGGTTAENIDYFDVMKHWLPLVFIFVLGMSFVLLTVAFRSIVIAGTAILLNLLSVGATYGLLVLVFQHGIGTGLLGFQQVDIVEAWVPLFLFAVLFGLSMDYQVFLLSRIRERYTQTGDTNDAIAFGIGSTARIITGAALIIVAVFLGFAMGELVMFQQMGFGIAIALLIDATIVRSVLVPAAMTMLGSWNWYLPKWLDWLPHMEVEGGSHEAPGGARAR